MGKKLAGVTFVRNAVKLDYCIEACIRSLQAFCDYVVIVFVEGEDETETLITSLTKGQQVSLIVCTQKEWESQKGREKLAYFQNIGIEYAKSEGYEYVFLCQADECVDENSIPHIKRAVELGEEAYFVTRHNMWASSKTMLNVPQSKKPCSTVINRLTKSNFLSVGDGESIATNTASLDFINLIEIYHMGYIRNPKKHIEKIKEIQGNIFLMDYDVRANIKPEFDWKDWGFTEKDLIPIPKPLPIYVQDWAKDK